MANIPRIESTSGIDIEVRRDLYDLIDLAVDKINKGFDKKLVRIVWGPLPILKNLLLPESS